MLPFFSLSPVKVFLFYSFSLFFGLYVMGIDRLGLGLFLRNLPYLSNEFRFFYDVFITLSIISLSTG
jgi:hypothetical protein